MWPWGSAIACAVRRSEKLLGRPLRVLRVLRVFKRFKRFKRLKPVGFRMKHAKGMFKRWHVRGGKRQAWTPIKGFKGFKG